MKPQPTGNDFAAFIGIDWADAKHDICLQAANAARRESSVLPHRPDAIEAWAGALRQRFQGQPIAVCLELAKGPLVYALQKYDFLVLFPVNPATLAKYRQAFTPSQAKDDPTDAELQLDLLLRHRDKLKPLHPQGVAMRTLQYLVEQRRRLVGDKGRITNRLIYALKQYFPQAVEWFKDKDTVVFCDFLSRWPTLKQAKHAFDAKTTTLAQTLPDYSLFRALPGAGATLAPRLLAAFGEQRERYHSAAELQKYTGIAPVTERSGKKQWVHWRLQCPKFLRQTFVEWAGETIPRSFWAAAYYRQQRDRGCSHQAALRALAFKWIRILYRCWQNRTPYDESTYLNALKRRGSPLLSSIAASP